MSERAVETEYSALQALLQIRTNQGDGAVTERGAVGNTETAGNVAATSNLANLLRLGAAQGSLLQQAAHNLSFTPTQLAAIRAAATLGIGRNGYLQEFALQNQAFMPTTAAAAARPALATLHQHSPLFEAISRDPSLAAAAPPPLEVPRSPAVSPIRPATTGARSMTKSPTEDGFPSDAGTEEAEKKIRKEEVEAALNSKPQRGRKRENLNAEERMELTRTRNREHAKSTRSARLRYC
jgi:hypothetical protein